MPVVSESSPEIAGVYDEILIGEDETGVQILPNASVLVLNTAGNAVMLYGSRNMTTANQVPNPTTSDARGNLVFHAPLGEYDLVVTPVGKPQQNPYRVRTAFDPPPGAKFVRDDDPRLTSIAAIAGQPLMMRPRPSPLITTFEANHGWTIPFGTPGAGTDLNSTEAFVRGTQSAKVVTTGLSELLNVDGQNLALNATGKQVRLTLRADKVANLHFEGIIFFLGNADFSAYYRWKVVSGSTGIHRDGEWLTYTLHFGEAEVTGVPDRANLTRARLQVIDAGGGVIATVRYDGVEFINEPAAFPNGVVSITFDDSWESVHTLGRTVMDKHGFPATNYVICDTVGVVERLSLNHLRELSDYAGWEVGAHSYSIFNHGEGFPQLTDEQLDDDFRRSKDWSARNGLGSMDHLAYPLGQFDGRVCNIAKRYFTTGRTVSGILGWPLETPTPGEPMRLRALTGIGFGSITPAAVAAQVDKTRIGKGWLILCFHKIVTGIPAFDTECNQADFQAIIDDIAADGIAVRTVGEVIKAVQR
jgi:peptidoglycan/xylan/chitin deacetylase (PgdA/CDA1 family)